MGRGMNLLALDIGTSKIAAVIAEMGGGYCLEVRGLGTSRCRGGLRRGAVVDFDAVAVAVADAVEKAERMAGSRRFTGAYVGVSGPHVKTAPTRGVVSSLGAGEIVRSDVERVLEVAASVDVPRGHEILHVIPKWFSVDGFDGIKDPVGMGGSRLEVQGEIVMADSACVENLVRAVYRAGLDVEGIVLSPLASGEAVLQQAEKESGVGVVDLGAGVTDIAAFCCGSLRFVSVVPIGGGHVTSDVMVGLKVPMEEAERIKVEGVPPSRPGREMASEAIGARISEIASLIDEEMDRAGIKDLLPAGIVLTGGSSKLGGLPEALRETLDLPVRLGFPMEVSGLVGLIADPSFSTAAGIAKVALESRLGASAGAPRREASRGRARWNRASQGRRPSSVKVLGSHIAKALDAIIGDFVRSSS